MPSDLLHRRTVLKGLGTVMALPWLEAMGLQTGWAAGNTPTKQAAPNRMAILYVPNGVNMDGWRVGAEGSLPSKLPAILAPLAAHKSDFSVLTGLTADKARVVGVLPAAQPVCRPIASSHGSAMTVPSPLRTVRRWRRSDGMAGLFLLRSF